MCTSGLIEKFPFQLRVRQRVEIASDLSLYDKRIQIDVISQKKKEIWWKHEYTRQKKKKEKTKKQQKSHGSYPIIEMSALAKDKDRNTQVNSDKQVNFKNESKKLFEHVYQLCRWWYSRMNYRFSGETSLFML